MLAFVLTSRSAPASGSPSSPARVRTEHRQELGARGAVAWEIVRWPIGIALIAVCLAALLCHSANRRQPGCAWLAFGAGVRSCCGPCRRSGSPSRSASRRTSARRTARSRASSRSSCGPSSRRSHLLRRRGCGRARGDQGGGRRDAPSTRRGFRSACSRLAAGLSRSSTFRGDRSARPATILPTLRRRHDACLAEDITSAAGTLYGSGVAAQVRAAFAGPRHPPGSTAAGRRACRAASPRLLSLRDRRDECSGRNAATSGVWKNHGTCCVRRRATVARARASGAPAVVQ